jgi:redox-sensitive bicupin YhaK (pirin superfamily)
METVLHKANLRGQANLEWLNAKHTFSFADYYNPDSMNFGVLRVLNDDIVAPDNGFGMHPHKNMEIVSIPLQGSLQHKDNMGNTALIKKGDVQVMSAGTGIMHSEFNISKDEAVNLLQIWILPNKLDVTPRYQQISLDIKDRINNLQPILSPYEIDKSVWIYQNAWFYMGIFDENFTLEYTLKNLNNGVYIFVIEGRFIAENIVLEKRDGLGIFNTNKISIQSKSSNAEILIMEVPMN